VHPFLRLNVKNFNSDDGLLLATIACNRKQIDIYGWISTMDYIGREILSCRRINNSLNRLSTGGLIIISENKVRLTSKSKKLLRKPWLMGVIDWQNRVQKRIVEECYDEMLLSERSFINEEEYIKSKELFDIKTENWINKHYK